MSSKTAKPQKKQEAAPSRSVAKAPAPTPPAKAPSTDKGANAGPMAKAGPALTIGSAPVQKKPLVGKGSDPSEREAESAATKVAAGQKAPPVQRMAKEEPVRRAASGQEQVDQKQEEAAEKAISEKGAGKPLEGPVRQQMESAFGADFSGVRVHDGPGAQDAARSLGARAFTHGSDVWLGQGESQRDRRLMAHELAHVVQQGGSVRRSQTGTPQPATGGGAGGSAGRPAAPTPEESQAMALQTGRLEQETLTFDSIPIPAFKLADHRGALYTSKTLKQKREYQRGNPDQRRRWKEGLQTGGIERALEQKLRAAYRNQPVDTSATHFFEVNTRPARYFIGDVPTIARELTLPSWDGRGQTREYHVDHIVELQLANWSEESWGNDLSNMELLDGTKNTTSGSQIKSAIDAKVRAFITATSGRWGDSATNVKRWYYLRFQRPMEGEGLSVDEHDFWTKGQVEAGNHLGPVNVSREPPLGREGEVRVFSTATGGFAKRFAWRGGDAPVEALSGERDWLTPFVITHKRFNTRESTGSFGEFTVGIPPGDKNWTFDSGENTITIQRIAGAQYAGYVDKRSVLDRLRSIRHKRMSPIRVDRFEVTESGGVEAAGQILPEVPLLREGGGINFEFQNGELTATHTLGPDELRVPAPFQIRDSSLTFGLSTAVGLSISGRVDFGIDQVGEGFIEGAASTQGLELQGRFNFDSELFDRAEVGLWFRDGAYGAEGTLAIGRGKVRGVRSGEIHVTYDRDTLSAEGSVQPDLPGVQSAQVTARYAEGQGFLIGGAIELGELPGIRSGRLEAQVLRQGDGYSFTGRGTAEPNIPGIASALTIAYADGAFDAQVRAEYRRGMLGGMIHAGVTNRPVSAEGQPSEGPAGESLSAYGSGSLTLQLAPWLQGTVGVQVQPDGRIQVAGEVGLPSALELFPMKAIEKELFRTPPLDIPILGVAVAGQRVGIFATLSGGLEARASIGPGQLRELGLRVTYSPDEEERTTVTGRAQFYVPAQAGLRLFARGGIGAGIPLVSATAGIEIGGELGVAGAAQADVQVDWSPQRGVSLEASAAVSAQPRFAFDLSGFLSVDAGIGPFCANLVDERFQLARFEYGSNLRFGIRFPVRYREGEPFDLSLSDVEFEVPQIDVSRTARDLVGRVAGGEV